MPSAHRRPFRVVSLYERQRERIATPACGLVRDDIYILGFFYSLGAILNETGDVISDIALYLPFLFLPESNASLVILMLFCTILTEVCGLLAQTINGIRSFAGPFGKSDRALIFGLWGLAVAIYPQWMQWNNLFWSIASILLIWTAINRCRSVLLMSAER